MSHRGPAIVLRLFSLALIVLGGALFVLQVERYQAVQFVYAQDQLVAGVPVGGLNREDAAERIRRAYARPVELNYDGAVVHLYPMEAGFQIDIDAMLDQAEAPVKALPFWDGFLAFLRSSPVSSRPVPLQATVDRDQLRLYLTEQIAARYDRPPSSAWPYPGTVQFNPGLSGAELDIDAAVQPVEAALQSLSGRQVTLPIRFTPPPPPPFQNLDAFLRQTVLLSGYDGVIGLYLLDLSSAEEVHFLYQNGQELPTDPDVAFTASSTIKIPIMVSVFRRLDGNLTPEITTNLERMVGKSDNPATDWVVQNLIEPFYGPIRVTEDIRTLGLENTFWAGYFYPGAPLLYQYITPANQRQDTNILRDPYNQTTPSEIGMLLGDIYNCAERNGGALLAAFPGEITPSECQKMIDYLIADRNPLLLQAGVPDGTRIAHKHGWITDLNYVIHDVSDAAIVFTPGGDYVIAVYLYHPTQLIFDPANDLVSDLSKAAYNYFNLPEPANPTLTQPDISQPDLSQPDLSQPAP